MKAIGCRRTISAGSSSSREGSREKCGEGDVAGYHRRPMSDELDVAGTQPPLLYPAYKSTILRAPLKPLIQLPRDFRNLAAPLFGDLPIGPGDNDLTRQHSGEPLGERIVVAGRVLDEDDRAVPNTLVELWQCN